MTKIAASQRQEVATMCMAGIPRKDVAKAFGVSYCCITAILRAAGVKPERQTIGRKPHIGSDRHAQMREMYRAGKSQAEIAKAFRVSAATVCKIFARIGITLADRPKHGVGAAGNYKRTVPVSSHDEMIAMYKAGSTLQEVGIKYGVSRERARQIIAAVGGINREDGGSAVKCFLNTSRKAEVARAANERTEARIRKTWGMSLDDYKAHVAEYGSSTASSSPMHKYKDQRKNARYRGIAWGFTFATWWAVWLESGKWTQRALSKDGYVMARYGDGDTTYSPENVYICTQSQNSKDSYIVSPAAERFKDSRTSAGNGRGYYQTRSGKYLAQFRRTNLGTFQTPDLARAAYLAAAEAHKGAAT